MRKSSCGETESKMLELLAGKLDRHLLIGLCSSLLKAAGRLQAVGAVCIDQLKGESSGQAVPLLGLLLLELAM